MEKIKVDEYKLRKLLQCIKYVNESLKNITEEEKKLYEELREISKYSFTLSFEDIKGNEDLKIISLQNIQELKNSMGEISNTISPIRDEYLRNKNNKEEIFMKKLLFIECHCISCSLNIDYVLYKPDYSFKNMEILIIDFEILSMRSDSVNIMLKECMHIFEEIKEQEEQLCERVDYTVEKIKRFLIDLIIFIHESRPTILKNSFTKDNISTENDILTENNKKEEYMMKISENYYSDMEVKGYDVLVTLKDMKKALVRYNIYEKLELEVNIVFDRIKELINFLRGLQRY